MKLFQSSSKMSGQNLPNILELCFSLTQDASSLLYPSIQGQEKFLFPKRFWPKNLDKDVWILSNEMTFIINFVKIGQLRL
jgi:hypothetical protein